MDMMTAQFVAHITETLGKIDVVVGVDARGFLFGPLISKALRCSFVPVRKIGKVIRGLVPLHLVFPWSCLRCSYVILSPSLHYPASCSSVILSPLLYHHTYKFCA